MAMRVRETPSGAVRVSYAVLETFLSGLGGLLVVAIVYPIFSSAGVCATDTTATDTTLYCGLAVAVLAWVLGAWLMTVWLSQVLRLGWLFMVATVVGQLVIIELVFQLDSLWWLLGLLVMPVMAALVSDPGHTRGELPRWQSVTILIVGLVVLVEFLAWGWFVVLAGG
jgi:hypothetical protein